MTEELSALSLLDVSDLSKILKIGMKSIYVKSSQSPQDLPPRIKLPGSRTLRWHPTVVKKWLDEQSGLSEPTVAITTPTPKKRRPGRPTKEEQIERQRGGAK